MTSLTQTYDRLKADRQPFLERAYEAAELTIPALLPREGHTSSSDLYDPHQSVGARGVNNLASKLLLTLFPPNQSFFRLGLSPEVEEELAQLSDEEKSAITAALSKQENEAQQAFEQTNPRPTLFEAFKHLAVTGNGMIERLQGGRLKFYRMDRFVVERDYAGNVMCIVIEEEVAHALLPDEVKSLCAEKNPKPDTMVTVYTGIELMDDGNYKKWQEVDSEVVPGSEVIVKKGQSPFIPLRWFSIDDENYGRGLVEEYIGDLKSLESLSKALNEGADQAAKVLYFIDPNSGLRSQDLMDKPNGGFVAGNRNDVGTLQSDKFADFQFVERQAANIERRLEQSFLLLSSIQRNAERVTAEEIRLMANELETTLGGVYSLQSEELQLPLVKLTIAKSLPKLKGNQVKPVVVTGIDGLGRSSELERIRGFISDAMGVLGQEQVIARLNPQSVLNQIAAGHGVEGFGLVRSEQEVQQEQNQQAALQAASAAAPALAEAAAQGE